jgi:hypothetical protein
VPVGSARENKETKILKDEQLNQKLDDVNEEDMSDYVLDNLEDSDEIEKKV